MTAGSLSQPKPLWKKALAFTSSDSPIQRSNPAREPSLVEMMSLSDWCRFVPETVGLLVVILVIRAVLPGGSLGSMPHPFWIPVLLMSSQYGIMGGLFATLAATALFFVSGLPVQSATQDFYAYAGIVAAQPCAWFGTALILGGLRSLHIHHQTELQERLDQTGRGGRGSGRWPGNARSARSSGWSSVSRATPARWRASSTVSAKLELSDRAVPACQRRRHYSLRCRRDQLCDLSQWREWAGAVPRRRGRLPPRARRDRRARAFPAPGDPCGGGATARCAGQDGRDCAARTPPYWAPIRVAGAAEPVGVVVCHRLHPSQDAAIAVRRLNEVCRVLAVLPLACPESSPEHAEMTENSSADALEADDKTPADRLWQGALKIGVACGPQDRCCSSSALLCLQSALFLAFAAGHLDMGLYISFHLGVCAITAMFGGWCFRAPQPLSA